MSAADKISFCSPCRPCLQRPSPLGQWPAGARLGMARPAARARPVGPFAHARRRLVALQCLALLPGTKCPRLRHGCPPGSAHGQGDSSPLADGCSISTSALRPPGRSTPEPSAEAPRSWRRLGRLDDGRVVQEPQEQAGPAQRAREREVPSRRLLVVVDELVSRVRGPSQKRAVLLGPTDARVHLDQIALAALGPEDLALDAVPLLVVGVCAPQGVDGRKVLVRQFGHLCEVNEVTRHGPFPRELDERAAGDVVRFEQVPFLERLLKRRVVKVALRLQCGLGHGGRAEDHAAGVVRRV
mmetsp:Transcript_22675/g.66858  ORF Transcript_22675/g.66858 Transcript_22675/m.66858 type:complete len:298 (+) Transcript_22675:79-972(+)